jgi:peptidoglycan/LPS O-acetylase OafA/YrhL
MRTIRQVLDEENNFDLLRLLAAIGVIYSHAFPVIDGSNQNEVLYRLSGGQFTVGELCVGVFFIISGFLITQSFLRAGSLIGYFTNRVLRIVPGLLAVTLVVCLVLGPIMTVATSQDYWSSYLTVRYLGNAMIYPAAQELPGVFATHAYPLVTNASVWTLSYEFSCYILIAAICLAIRRAWLQSLLMLGIAATTVFFTYVSPAIFLTFLSYFLAGSIAYAARGWVVLDRRIFFVSIAVLMLCVGFHKWLVPAFCIFGSYATFYLAYARPLTKYDAARYGDFSYGVYLYAWPIQQVVAPHTSSPFENFVVSAPITVIFAVMSWNLVEKPSLARKGALAKFLQRWVEVVRFGIARLIARGTPGA